MVHVGAADAPVTLAQIRDAIGECRDIKQSKLDILGWESGDACGPHTIFFSLTVATG